MTAKKNKAIFIVTNWPYKHPNEEEEVPVGAQVDLSHLPIETRIWMVERGRVKPTTDDALVIPPPEKPEEPPKLNKYGLPFGQVPEKTLPKAGSEKKSKEAS